MSINQVQNMFRFIFCLTMLTVSACSTTTPKLSNEALDSLRQGKLIVVFFDSVKQINYIVEIYEVLNITQRIVSSSYKNEWQSDEYITDIHTKEFAIHGFKTRKFLELFSNNDLTKVKVMHQQFLKNTKSNLNIKPILTPEIQNLLSERQIKHLVLIDWTGFSLFIKSQGKSPRELAISNYKIFNTTTGNLIWQGSSHADISTNLQKKDGKVFLEENNYARFKFEIKRLIRSQYTREKNSILQSIGFKK